MNPFYNHRKLCWSFLLPLSRTTAYKHLLMLSKAFFHIRTTEPSAANTLFSCKTNVYYLRPKTSQFRIHFALSVYDS